MPVGTAGTVKAMTADAVRATGAAIVLGNTYHLMLRPGAERIARLGRPASLHGLARSNPDRFRRLPGHVAGEAAQARRGRRHLPVASRRLDASPDAGTLDRNPAPARMPPSPWCWTSARRFPPTPDAGARVHATVDALGRSGRATAFRPATGYGLFGIVQGSVYPDLREASARALRRSASTATRSAAWRSAKARRRSSPCSTPPCRTCRRTHRAT